MANMANSKVCVVTGVTSGIGKGAAIGLARQGCHVLMVSRTQERGQLALDEIKSLVPGAQLELLCADLASQRAIAQLAESLKANHSRIDAVVNCAGTFSYARTETIDGIETNFAVNYLSAFLLTRELRPLLEQSDDGRVVTVSGEFHRRVRLDFADLQCKNAYSGMRAAARGTLAKAVFTFELARRLKAEGSKVTANCFHPGAVRSELTRDLPWYLRAVANMAIPFMRGIEKGAATGVFLATSPSVRGISGEYFIDEKIVTPSQYSRDPAVGERLWKLTEALISFG